MIGRFFGWLVNKLRFKRFALSGNIKLLEQFGFYYGHYANWKHDPTPLIFVMHSGPDYTHAINTHYMSRPDKEWFARMLYLIKKGGQNVDGLTMYRLLKLKRRSIVQSSYRVYFTRLLKMKLAGAGLTPLDRLVYPVTKDPWLMTVNEMLKPEEISEGLSRYAYSPTELQDRINQSVNAIPLQQQSVRPRTGPSAPYTRTAPWVRTP